MPRTPPAFCRMRTSFSMRGPPSSARAEIVDAQQRAARRRRRHRVLVERSPSTMPQATPRDFSSGTRPARTSEVLPIPDSP